MNSTVFVRQVVDALEELGIPYMAVGSFSTNVYGHPRSTKDADFVIQLQDKTVRSLANRIGLDFILDPQMSFETVTSTTRYRMKHRTSEFMIELFLLSDDAHDQMRFARRVSGILGGRKAFVPTAEDVIITKLRWSRHGQRKKDTDDAQDVIDVQYGKLDLQYLRHWCGLHGTLDLFEQMLKEAERLNTPPITE